MIGQVLSTFNLDAFNRPKKSAYEDKGCHMIAQVLSTKSFWIQCVTLDFFCALDVHSSSLYTTTTTLVVVVVLLQRRRVKVYDDDDASKCSIEHACESKSRGIVPRAPQSLTTAHS